MEQTITCTRSRTLIARAMFTAFTMIGLLTTPCVADPTDTSDGFSPDQTTLPVSPPQGAIVLFDGKSNLFLSKRGKEINWPVVDGAMVSTRGMGRSNHVVSRLRFRDADIHAEFLIDNKQSGGNSGLYIHGNYELQIMHSFGKQTPTMNDLGALYGFSKPLVNAARPLNAWQVYDIRFRAPRRDAKGKIVEEGSLTAWLNGQLVQKNARFGEPRSRYHPYRYNTTPYLKAIWEKQLETGQGPLFLQDHDSPVRFRNVWVLPRDKHFEIVDGPEGAAD